MELAHERPIFVCPGQLALAYVTAASHGLAEEAERLAEKVTEAGIELPSVDADAQLLLPPAPILKEDNWPLLTVSKGFFEKLAAGGGRNIIKFHGTPFCSAFLQGSDRHVSLKGAVTAFGVFPNLR